MNTAQDTQTAAPPRLMQAFVAGFNTVANNVQLILPPLLLDLFIWLGPHLGLKDLFLPRVRQVLADLAALASPEMTGMLEQAGKGYEEIFTSFNVFDALSTFPPVGVPSLLRFQPVQANPFGPIKALQIASDGQLLLLFAFLTLAGFFIGSLFYGMVARTVVKSAHPPFSAGITLRQMSQAILLALLLLTLFIVLTIPLAIVLSLIYAITPNLVTFSMLVVLFLAFWFIVPLLFSAHGIFAYQQTAVSSTLISIRLVRFFMPGTGTFFIMLTVLSLGLNMLWLSPPPTSWLALIGLAGHAFISTALLAASFSYYRDGMQWMQFNLQKTAAAPTVA